MRFDHTKLIIFGLVNIAAIAIVCYQTTHAQSGTASVSGTVVDQRKGSFQARAELTNVEKAFTRTVQTNADGTFSFPAIQPGIYRLQVELAGFKKFVNDKVRTFVDSPTEISAVLEVGNINETINVTNNTVESLLNTQDATIGNPFNSNQVTQLPDRSPRCHQSY